MNVHYMSDGEQNGIMTLDELIANFNRSGTWISGYCEQDMRDELNSRGWYEGLHDFGRYLVLNIGKTDLQPNAYWK